MKRFLTISLVLLSAITEGAEPEPAAIPLDQIWAYQMQDLRNKSDAPQPRDIRELEPESFGKAEEGQLKFDAYRRLITSRISQIIRKINSLRDVGPGFVVLGTGEMALREVHNVLVAGERSADSFPAGEPLSVFFYTRGFTTYVRFDKIEQAPDRITIRYKLVPKLSDDSRLHFALIPIGSLQPGRVKVSFVQSPMEQKYLDQGFRPVDKNLMSRLICKSFEFTVVPKKSTQN